MTQVMVKEPAQVVDTPVERLLLQMHDVGLPHISAEQIVTNSEKQALLAHLKGNRGDRASEPHKITLQCKTTTILEVGGSKMMSAEIHKKRTYVKRSSDGIEIECQRELEEQRAAEEARRLKAEEAATHQRAEEEAHKAKGAARTKAAQEAMATTSTEPAVVTDVVVAKPVAKPTTMEERKKEELHRVPKRDENDDHRDHKHTQHRPPVERKEEAPAPCVTPRSTDEEGDGYRYGGRGGKPRLEKHNQYGSQNPTRPIVREVSISEIITVAKLAAQMPVKGIEVVRFMLKMDSPVTISQVPDQGTAQLVVERPGHKIRLVSESVLEKQLAESLKLEGETVTRAPVVTVMDHVDHGKTLLLDYIRRAKVVAGEAGGITQHIGTYHAETECSMVIFLDIPGRAAFTVMRAHGTQATDIMIPVVAVGNGVMLQTQEAVQHVRVAGVSIVIAMDKIDKPEASPDNIKNGLATLDVIPEEWGGDALFVLVSAKLGIGVDELLEAVLLQTEVLELKATPSAPGRGMVVESRLDKGRGPVAAVLIQDGTLRQGDMVLVGISYGRVRAILGKNGKPIKEADPSIPVEILGLDGTPDIGDETIMVVDEEKVRGVTLSR